MLSTQAQEKLGPVDMLVNCAGTAISGKFEEMEVERFKVSPSKPLLLTWGKKKERNKIVFSFINRVINNELTTSYIYRAKCVFKT